MDTVVFVRGDDVEDLLAQLEAEKLWEKSAPRWLSTAASGFDHDGPILVDDMEHRPRPTTRQETAHAINQTVDKVLFQRSCVWLNPPCAGGQIAPS